MTLGGGSRNEESWGWGTFQQCCLPGCLRACCVASSASGLHLCMGKFRNPTAGRQVGTPANGLWRTQTRRLDVAQRTKERPFTYVRCTYLRKNAARAECEIEMRRSRLVLPMLPEPRPLQPPPPRPCIEQHVRQQGGASFARCERCTGLNNVIIMLP